VREALRDLLRCPGVRLGGEAWTDPERGILSTGWEALDALLPGGWPRGTLTEIVVPREGTGEVRLLLPVLARLGRQGRWLAWIDPPYLPYAPALAAAGLALSRVLVIRAGAERDRLWAAVQCLRSGACGAVLAWPCRPRDDDLRRLRLAAGEGDALGVLFRRGEEGDSGGWGALRLRVVPSRRGVAVELLSGGAGSGKRAEIPLFGEEAGAPEELSLSREARA